MITIRGLSKRLGRKQVLKNMDLEVRNGETMVVLGPSGTGKSVLLKHIIGLMAPDEGSILVDGEEIVGKTEQELNRLRRKFGMLFQSSALFDSMTVYENLALPMVEHQRDMDTEKVRERVAERLEWVGLKGSENLMPASLSGGMRKRVGLARALSMDPEIILYDEPTTGLDPITAGVIDQLIRALQKRLGVTSIAVTHDLQSAFKIGDRMALLYEGHVVFQGTPEDMQQTDNPMVRQFFEGSSLGPIQPV